MQIRTDRDADRAIIRELIRSAFANQRFSNHREHEIVDRLRADQAMSVSLCAELNNEILGYVACSPVEIDAKPSNWHGLGPLAVRPDNQRLGIGGRLMMVAIDRLTAAGAAGIVLLGEPAYYRRFGFSQCSTLTLPGVPAEYFMQRTISGVQPTGVVRYHDAFSAG